MPLIKIVPRDILEIRATETLRQIARYDASDLRGEFEPEWFSHLTELSAIRKEAEALGLDWQEFYALVANQMEIYESGREEQCHDGEWDRDRTWNEHYTSRRWITEFPRRQQRGRISTSCLPVPPR